MLKLEATLIARTAAEPRRAGWSPDRGIDFIAWSPVRQAAATPPEMPRITAAEPVSFVDADDIMPPGVTVVRRFVSLAAQAAEADVGERADIPLTRAWSSLARKLPGS